MGTLTKRLQDLEDKNNEMAIEIAQRNETHDHMMKAILELEQELEKVKISSSNQQSQFLQSTLMYQQQQQ